MGNKSGKKIEKEEDCSVEEGLSITSQQTSDDVINRHDGEEDIETDEERPSKRRSEYSLCFRKTCIFCSNIRVVKRNKTSVQ